jgi:polysaccharide biosynthesis protein PslH
LSQEENMHILFLSRWYPYPADNGSKIRIYNLIKHLAAHHDVELIAFREGEISPARIAAMREFCVRVETTALRPFDTGLRSLPGLLSQRPRSVIDTDSPEMHRIVTEGHRRHPYDAVIASQIDMAPYALDLDGVTRVWEEIELATAFDRFQGNSRPLNRMRRSLTWYKLAGYVAHLAAGFDGHTVVSDREAELFAQAAKGRYQAAVIPNGTALNDQAPAAGPEPDSLIYAGALTYAANFDAMDYFIREIMPAIQHGRPEARLTITGSVQGVSLDHLPANDAVHFSGYLEDIRPAIQGSWASVVPLREGGGTRLKVLESLALGTPVVSTAKGAEGLNLRPGRDFLLADTPSGFAAAVVSLLRDPQLRARLSNAGRQAVEGQYDWRSIGRRFNDFVEDAVSRSHRVYSHSWQGQQASQEWPVSPASDGRQASKERLS